MATYNPARDLITRVGNWHDTLDMSGEGSLIAQMKFLADSANKTTVPPYFNQQDRDIRNRLGNWDDDVDIDGNGSLIAQVKMFQLRFNALVAQIDNLNIVKNARFTSANYPIAANDDIVTIDCSINPVTATFIPGTAALQETKIVKVLGGGGGDFSLTVSDGTDVIDVINDPDVVGIYKDMTTYIQKIK